MNEKMNFQEHLKQHLHLSFFAYAGKTCKTIKAMTEKSGGTCSILK